MQHRAASERTCLVNWCVREELSGLGGLPASPATAEQIQGCASGVRGTSTSRRDSCLVLFHASPVSQGQMLNLLHLVPVEIPRDSLPSTTASGLRCLQG